MSATARALAARFYEAVNAGDLDPALALLADDVVWHRPPDVPVTGVVEGREKVRRMWAAFIEPLDRFEIEPTGYEGEGGQVLVRITMRGSAPEGRGDFEFAGAQVFRCEDGRIAEVLEFRTLPEARAALS